MNKDQDRVDRLIQSVLTVSPSPEFESRIRGRIRREACVHRVAFRPGVFGCGLLAAAAIVLILIGLPQRESSRVEKVTQSTLVASPANTGANDSQPSPVVAAVPEEKSHPVMKTIVVAAGDPLAKAASAALTPEALRLPPLKEFSLETSTPLLVTAAVQPDQSLPKFEIQPFFLLSSNEGVAE